MSVAALERRAADEIAGFDYPSRDWLLPGTRPEVAIVGHGQVGLMMALALRRERIDRIVVFRDPVDRAGVYAALAEQPRLPRLDFAGRELSAPALGLPAWMEARNLVADTMSGPALAALWLEYLEWLARQVGVVAVASARSVRADADGVMVETGGVPVPARRAVVAWSSWTQAGCLAPDLPPGVAGRHVAIRGDDAAACDMALTALALGAAGVTLCPGPAADAGTTLDGHEVVHGFGQLPPARRSAIRAAAARVAVPAPEGWRARLGGDPRVRRGAIPGAGALVFTPGEPLPPLLDAGAIERGTDDELAAAGIPRLFLLMPDPAAAAGPIVHPSNLVRYGVLRVGTAISRGLFLEDAEALFGSYLAAEANGG